MTRHLWVLVGLAMGASLFVAACGSSQNFRSLQLSPTVGAAASQTVVLAAPTQTPGGPTLTASPTLPPTVTPSNTPPPPPPTATATPTATPGPYEHVIQSGDTCLGIAYEYGHVHPDVKKAIEALNGMTDCSILPGPGATILIPRPTATATPIGADMTQTAVATSAPPRATLSVAASFAVQPYSVGEGDTLSSIAIAFDSSLRQICELNPLPNGIDCGACQWESPNCCCTRSIVLSNGQQINVPAPTPTPTFTPTFTGSETPTATPTHRAPSPVYPLDGASVRGIVRLTWLSAGVLADDEYYLVSVRDETTGGVFNQSTRQLSLDVPPEHLPSDGQTHTLTWNVTVVRLGADGLYYPQGEAVPMQRFEWTAG